MVDTLIAYYDATHAGLNHFLDRKFTPVTSKVRVAVDEVRMLMGCAPKHYRKEFSFVLLALALTIPMFLSPTHPLAVYAFLPAAHAIPPAVGSASTSQEDLEEFLTSPIQIQRYQRDLYDDFVDTNSEHMFVIVRLPNGRLKEEAIRTWNGMLPRLQEPLRNYLDTKCFPYLGDEVDVWLRGSTIVAHGHYHAFGGPPSESDLDLQNLTSLPEIVVSNGLIPLVYADGDLLKYGHNVIVTPEVFSAVRPLEGYIRADGGGVRFLTPWPTDTVKAFLGYLKDYRGVNTNSIADIQQCVGKMYAEFRATYADAIPKWATTIPYQSINPDIGSFAREVAVLNYWSRSDITQ